MSNSITSGVDISKLLLKSIYDPAGLQSISAHNHRRIVHKYVASDIIQGANDPAQSTTSTTWTKANTLKQNYHEPGTIRISFQLVSTQGHPVISGQIRRNGVVLGIQRDMVGTHPFTFTEDFNMSQFVEGGNIEVWIKCGGVGPTATIRNLRVMHDSIILQKEMYTPV